MYAIVICLMLGIVAAIAISTILSSLDASSDENAVNSPTKAQIRRSPISGEMRNMFWIVQLSDIHISKYKDSARGPDLQKFCDEYIPVINPKLVLITGDLTDAKVQDGIESQQIEDEWIMYENIMKRCSTLSQAKWLDLRGNHDSFDVSHFDSKNNYFRSHSVRKTGSQNPTELDGAYVHQLELPYGVYSFIGIDACSKPGLHRPFNFFGYLNEAQIQHLKKLSALTKHSNQTIWFGHFPTSLIVHDPPILRQIMGNGIAYLCGHLHTMFGYVPNMFAKHKTGQLELELGDWKENRMFRVLVMDHDILTFTDAKLGDWPLVVITNPKDKQFISPTLEPIDLIATSSHIRIVAFSSAPIKMITVKLDNRIVGEAYQVWRGYPLYTLSWTPQLFVYGQHTIQVFVQDEMGRNKTIKQHFTLEIAEKKFGIVSRALLMLNIYSLGKLVFGLLVFFYVFILTSFRQCMCIRLYYLRDVMLLGPVVNSFLMKIWLAARTNVAYYILVGSVLYLTFGPWFIGHLLTDQLGVVFVWGILINGSFIPGGLTFFYGIFQFLSFNLPLTLILGHQLDLQRKHGKRLTLLKHMSILAPAVVLLVITTKLALTEFPAAYGVEALLYGPLRTGNVLLLPAAVWLAYRTDLRKILAVNEPA